MEAFGVYLLKSSALMALFYAGYRFFLLRETFFKSNRWYLLLGLVTSVMLPLITIRKTVWIDPLPGEFDWAATGPVITAGEPQGFEVNWPLAFGVVYLTGVLVLVLKLLMDFYLLRKALKGKAVFRNGAFKFVDTDEAVAPFSYFGYIVYNSSLFTPAELINVIEHEKVHSNQNHTVDVLFARAFCIVFWFSPLVWLYKKAMLQNLEFIADSEATKNIDDKKLYQITLLKVTAHENCVDITNHFYQSLIKKRIVMLNQNQSKKSKSWKYFLIVPALAAFMVFFQVRVVAQERPPRLETRPQNGADVLVTKKSSDADLKREAQRVKEEHGVTLKFSKVKRNGNGEITGIKASYKDQDGKKGTTQVSGNQPIQPFRFYKNNDRMGFIGGGEIRVAGIGANAPTGLDDDFAFSFSPGDFDIEIPQVPEPPENMEAPLPPTGNFAPMPKGRSIVIKSKDGKNKVIVDGKAVPEADLDKILSEIGPITINGEDVLKNGGVYAYSLSGKGNGTGYVIDTDKIAKEAHEKARAAMDKAAPKIEKAREKMEKRRVEIEKRRVEIDARRDSGLPQDQDRISAREIEQAREELAKARAELDKARSEMSAELEKQRAELARERQKTNKP